ncbi:hypothetical protein CPB85DRAFT_1434460 [Mucidula mucida]|nr:hypothetical protein CPB85DRAFT_1434460 [Mucidula mucida]
MSPKADHERLGNGRREKDDRSDILALLGVKLFSVSPSEMCNERTASRLTAQNTAKRNGLSGEHLVQVAQLQQHWMYGLEAPKHKHNSHLKLPAESASGSNKLYKATPTVSDLLNPLPDDQSLCDTDPDPFGLQALQDGQEDNDDDLDIAFPEPHIVRGAPRLQIKELVRLDEPKLLARYEGSPSVPKALVSQRKQTQKDGQWVEERWGLADINF